MTISNKKKLIRYINKIIHKQSQKRSSKNVKKLKKVLKMKLQFLTNNEKQIVINLINILLQFYKDNTNIKSNPKKINKSFFNQVEKELYKSDIKNDGSFSDDLESIIIANDTVISTPILTPPTPTIPIEIILEEPKYVSNPDIEKVLQQLSHKLSNKEGKLSILSDIISKLDNTEQRTEETQNINDELLVDNIANYMNDLFDHMYTDIQMNPKSNEKEKHKNLEILVLHNTCLLDFLESKM